MIRPQVAGTILLTLLMSTAVAEIVPLNFTVITPETGPGVPPLDPIVWHVSRPDGAAVALMESTPQSIDPTMATVWRATVGPASTSLDIRIEGSFVDEGDSPVTYVRFDLSGITGDVIEISNAHTDPIGRLNFDIKSNSRSNTGNSTIWCTIGQRRITSRPTTPEFYG